MNTYLFAWNPNKWKWITLEDSIAELIDTGKVTEQWSCQSYRSIKPGDRAFLAKVGVSPKGIIGSGIVTTFPFISRHWSGEDKDVYCVMIQFDALLNADKEPILTTDMLNQANLHQQVWTPQSSGISVKPDVIEELEAVWFNFLTSQEIRYKPFTVEDVEEKSVYSEGTPSQITLTKYERNPYARKKCLEHYGTSCSVCNFNFEKVYGEIGKDFIHVHHLTQVAKVDKTYSVDPIKDLRPVCPNCHAMIHRKKEAISPEELKSRLLLH
jgi:5-methylcytosine-specific restriction protein A